MCDLNYYDKHVLLCNYYYTCTLIIDFSNLYLYAIASN